MIIYVDLDNTLCKTNGLSYEKSIPIKERILKINNLYISNRIVIYTARGSKTGVDHRDLTEKQLKKWGVKYHELNIGNKPVFDLLIDDRAVSDKEFFSTN